MPKIPVSCLQPGVFISLDGMRWMDHPFLLNSFRLVNEKQIQVLREMGLKTVEWDPGRSTVAPLQEQPPKKEDETDFGSNALGAMLDIKRGRVERVRAQREGLARCERFFERESESIGQVLQELDAQPNEAHAKAKGAVGRIVAGIADAGSVAVHFVNLKAKEAGQPQHAMNVMVLSLLVGKAIGIDVEEMKTLGLGALLHDVGKSEIPARVLRNPKRTASEEQFYQAHVGYGIKRVARIQDLSVQAKNVIACHHERWNGEGFPNRLAGAKIPRLARIVAIANRYDNLCNPLDPGSAMTPAEAVAHMFKRDTGWFDPDLLQLFVKALGVYPPGSFVSLSDGSIGLVVETNSKDLLRPVIMMYDESVPRTEALLLDLKETGATIESVVNPANLPLEAVEYLAPRGRVDYYIDGGRT